MESVRTFIQNILFGLCLLATLGTTTDCQAQAFCPVSAQSVATLDAERLVPLCVRTFTDKIGCFVFEPLPDFIDQLAYYIFSPAGDPMDTFRYDAVVDHGEQAVWVLWHVDRWVVVLQRSDANPIILTMAEDGTQLSSAELITPTAAADWLFLTDVSTAENQVLVSAHEYDTIQLYRYTVGSGVVERYATPNPALERPYFPHLFSDKPAFFADGGLSLAPGSDGIVRYCFDSTGLISGIDTVLRTPGATGPTIMSVRLNAGRYDLLALGQRVGIPFPALLSLQIDADDLGVLQADTFSATLVSLPAPGLEARLSHQGIDAQLFRQRVTFTQDDLFVRLIDSVSGALIADYQVDHVSNAAFGFSVSAGVYSFLAKDEPTDIYNVHFLDAASGEPCSGTLPELSAFDFNPLMVGTAGFDRRWFLHAEDNGVLERLRLYAVDGGLVSALGAAVSTAADCAQRYRIFTSGQGSPVLWQRNATVSSADNLSVFNAFGQHLFSQELSPAGEITLFPALQPGWYALQVDDPQCPRAMPFVVAP